MAFRHASRPLLRALCAGGVFMSGAATCAAAAPPYDGVGAADIVENGSAVLEHRTRERFRLVRSGTADGGASPSHYLLGCNVRCMLGWCRLSIARAYAFGLYADGAALTAAGHMRPGSSSSTTTTTTTLVDELLDAKERGDVSAGELSLVLTMARDIPGEHMAHGFRNSILFRLKQRAAGSLPPSNRSAALASGQAAAGLVSPTSPPSPSPSPAPSSSSSSSDAVVQLHAFADIFSGVEFAVHDELVLLWRRDGTLVATLTGRAAETWAARHGGGGGGGGGGGAAPSPVTDPLIITDRAVIRSLFDVYLSEKAVSWRGRDTLRANLAAAAEASAAAKGRVDEGLLAGIVLREHASRLK
jgi:hypothetical protein